MRLHQEPVAALPIGIQRDGLDGALDGKAGLAGEESHLSQAVQRPDQLALKLAALGLSPEPAQLRQERTSSYRRGNRGGSEHLAWVALT